MLSASSLVCDVSHTISGYTFFLRMVLNAVKKFESIRILRLALVPLAQPTTGDQASNSDVINAANTSSVKTGDSISVDTKRAKFVVTSAKQTAVNQDESTTGKNIFLCCRTISTITAIKCTKMYFIYARCSRVR